MVKYKPELKAQIVHEYLSTAQSTNDLSKKYHIERRQIAKWIQGYRLNGPDVLKRRRHKRNFTADTYAFCFTVFSFLLISVTIIFIFPQVLHYQETQLDNAEASLP